MDTEFFAVKTGDARANANVKAPLERPLVPMDVAQTVAFQLAMPDHVDVNDVKIRPTQQIS